MQAVRCKGHHCDHTTLRSSPLCCPRAHAMLAAKIQIFKIFAFASSNCMMESVKVRYGGGLQPSWASNRVHTQHSRHGRFSVVHFLPALQMYREAAVLAQLGNHPCIVNFYGLAIEEQQQPSTPAAHPGGFGGLRQHDSADSVGRSSFGTCAGLTGAPKKLSVGLVMERCDGSLKALLDNQPQGSLLPLSDLLHIATCIAGGLKYFHQDAPIKVRRDGHDGTYKARLQEAVPSHAVFCQDLACTVAVPQRPLCIASTVHPMDLMGRT